jgi:hypothetical protein
VHLATAGLSLGKINLAAQPLKQRHHRAPGLREQRVVEAGDEKGDPHDARLGSVDDHPPEHVGGLQAHDHAHGEPNDVSPADDAADCLAAVTCSAPDSEFDGMSEAVAATPSQPIIGLMKAKVPPAQRPSDPAVIVRLDWFHHIR